MKKDGRRNNDSCWHSHCFSAWGPWLTCGTVDSGPWPRTEKRTKVSVCCIQFIVLPRGAGSHRRQVTNQVIEHFLCACAVLDPKEHLIIENLGKQRSASRKKQSTPQVIFRQGSGICTGFPGGSDSKVSVCNAGDLGSIPGLGRCPGEGNGSPLQYSFFFFFTPVFLPGKFHGRRSLVGYRPWGCKESDTTERLHFTGICAHVCMRISAYILIYRCLKIILKNV